MNKKNTIAAIYHLLREHWPMALWQALDVNYLNNVNY